MENKNETEVSTQQYYGNVEATVEEQVVETPVVEEEQSYSLEDLHPEEKVKEVAPVAAPEEEIQPDPTVIDGVRETIGDQSAIEEQVAEVPQQPVQPAPQQIISSIPRPAIPTNAGTVNKQIKVSKPQNNNDVPNAKAFYLIFGIILLVVIVGLPLYSSINNSLNPQTGVSEPIKEEPKEEPKEDENKEQQENPTITEQTPNNEIVFDMSLEFDKGLVSNPKEINQKVGFLPTELTGIIRCDFEKPVVMEGITMLGSTYLHYENYKLVGAITVTKQQYPTETLYNETKDATLIYQNAGDKNDSLDVKIIQDDSTKTVTNIMKYNLEYGNSTYIEELETNILFSSVHGTNIKTAIEKALVTGANSGNAVCSSIVTSDAGL